MDKQYRDWLVSSLTNGRYFIFVNNKGRKVEVYRKGDIYILDGMPYYEEFELAYQMANYLQDNNFSEVA